MSARRNLYIPIGHDAHARAGARHRLGIWRPSLAEPAQPFARLRYQPEEGGPREIIVWLPGPHPMMPHGGKSSDSGSLTERADSHCAIVRGVHVASSWPDNTSERING